MKIKTTPPVLLLIFLSLIGWTVEMSAQTGVPFNQRDDQYPLLGLKRAKEAYEYAQADFARKEQMYEKELISQQDLEHARNALADAEVNYQQSLLAVLFEQQYVAVEQAVKYQDDRGKKHVRLRLANTSGGGGDFKKLLNIDDELFRSLQPDVVNDVYVSLLNQDNAIISQPYEAKIEQLVYGHPVDIDFTLLQDLDAVSVDIVYGNGSRRTPKIFLQKDESENKVMVQSQQFSQEVELGGSATFDLTLELFSGSDNTFKLEVVNLTEQLNRYFTDPSTQARLSQFKFTQSANTRQAALKVFLPDRPTEDVVMDRPIQFYVLVIPRDRIGALGNLHGKTWTLEEIKALEVGFVKLELLPRGVGELLVRAPQLYHTCLPGETVEMDMALINEGSRRLDNVEVTIDAPMGWTKEVAPRVLPALDIREEKPVTLRFTPPSDIAVGRYELRVRSTSLSDNQPVNGEDKTVTIEIRPKANVAGTLIIILLILGTVGGIIVFGVRLSKR